MPPRLVKASASLALREDRPFRLALVADTHSAPHPALLDQLAALRPDAILHAGDIGDEAVIARLEKLAPAFAVRGNIDPRGRFPDTLTLDLKGRGRGLRVFMTHIALAGFRLRADIARRARAERASLVVCGHSHVPYLDREGELTVFNPGSAGPRRAYLPTVFGTMTVAPDGVRLAHVDCATGQEWVPPQR